MDSNAKLWRGVMTVCACLVISGCVTQETDAPMIEDPESCLVDAPEMPDACVGPRLSEYYCTSFARGEVENPQTIGSSQAQWVLQDLQPQSCGYEQYYGLDAFHGSPTMVVLLWAGCGFCQTQTEMLQQMHFELQAANVDVDFVIVDLAATNPPIQELTDRCNFPIFQDESIVNAWGLMGGKKDDFYFYDSNGVLKNFIPHTDDIVLSTESGYANVKNTVLDLVENDGQRPRQEDVETDEAASEAP